MQVGDSRLTEVTVLAFVLSHALWDGLLGLAVLEGAEIEGPDLVRFCQSLTSCVSKLFKRAP